MMKCQIDNSHLTVKGQFFKEAKITEIGKNDIVNVFL